MPLVRSSASKRRAYIIAVILLLSKVMPIYFYCVLKGLIYIIIITLLGRQSSFYIKCIKLNMHLSCNIRLMSNTKCACLIHSYILQSLRLPYLICLRVLYNGYCRETQL